MSHAVAMPFPGVPHLPRRLALLGGTTTAGDALTALALLRRPRRLVDGDAVGGYERQFATRCGVAHAVSFSHGRVALYGLLEAYGIGDGDDVLMQAPTHVVVANAVRYRGARPLFVDCERDTLNMELAQAERRITPRTRALVLQHTFGTPADLEGARRLCDRHGLVLIEDCVHALGATYGGRPVGSVGDAAFYSTEETKTISTVMGGMAVTNDQAVAARLEAFRGRCAPPSAWLVSRYLLKLAAYHLLTEPRLHRLTRPLYEVAGRRNPLPGPTTVDERRGFLPPDYHRRFSDAQAVLGLRQLATLAENIAHRRRLTAVYRGEFGRLGVCGPRVPAGAEPAMVRFPVWVNDRRRAIEALRPLTVPGLWFTSVLEEAANPSVCGYTPGSCPVAERAAAHLINLPTHRRVTVGDARAMVRAVAPWAVRDGNHDEVSL